MVAQPGEISRRRVLAGVAWTTPAIVLAVSVPRAAASEGDTVEGVDVLTIYNFTVSDGTFGHVAGNATFATEWTAGYPENLGPITFHYSVHVTGDLDFTSDEFTIQATGNPANPGTVAIQLDDVPAGTYSAELTVWAQAYDPTTDTTYVAASKSLPSTPAVFTVMPAA